MLFLKSARPIFLRKLLPTCLRSTLGGHNAYLKDGIGKLYWNTKIES